MFFLYPPLFFNKFKIRTTLAIALSHLSAPLCTRITIHTRNWKGVATLWQCLATLLKTEEQESTQTWSCLILLLEGLSHPVGPRLHTQVTGDVFPSLYDPKLVSLASVVIKTFETLALVHFNSYREAWLCNLPTGQIGQLYNHYGVTSSSISTIQGSVSTCN